jgi:hypothetical protein
MNNTGNSLGDLHDNDEPDAELYNDKVHQDAAKKAFLQDAEGDDEEDKIILRRILSGKYDGLSDEISDNYMDDVDDKWDKYKV